MYRSETDRTHENIQRLETYKPLWGGSKNLGMVEQKVPEAERGCGRWFCNNAGLTKHMRSKHWIPPLQAHPIPTPWPLAADNSDPQPIDDPQFIDDWPNSPPPDPPPANGGWRNNVYLPPGTTPSPPPAWAPDDWTPYHNRVQMSGNDINVLSQLWCASLINHGVPPDKINLFNSQDSLYATINATPFGDAVWQGFSLSYSGRRPDNTPEWMTKTYNVWHQDACQLLHNMLANSDFNNEFNYVPFHDGNWAWREANIIANNPETCGTMLVPIILGSDKTTVSVAMGHNEYYPVYMSIGNVQNNIRHAHRNAIILLGFLAIPKTDKRHTDDNEFRKFCRQLFHLSLAQILSSVRPVMSTPEVTQTPDGHFYQVIYSIGPYIVDYPEQALLACIVQGCCTALPSNLDIGGEQQSQELTNALINILDPGSLWSQYGIVGYVMPFTSEFPWADIHKLVAPNILHQVIKGTFKDHLVTWVEEYLELSHGKTYAKMILDDIDHRIVLAPPFPGLCHFPQGCGFKQWTGDDLKVLMKVYLPALEGHMPADMICTFRAFLDFCYVVRRDMFNDDTLGLVQNALDCFHHFRLIFQAVGVHLNGFSLPRQHSLCHYRHLIHLFGAPNGLCSSITESKHIKAIKEPWHRLNRCNTLGQMLIINQHLDQLAALCSYFESRGMLKSTVLADAYAPADALDADTAPHSAKAVQGTDPHEVDETRPVDDKDAVSHVWLPENRQRGYPSSVMELATVSQQPDFQDLLCHFLFDQLHMDDPNAPAGSDVPLAQCPPFNAVFFSPSDPSGLQGMHSECIRCNPRWRKQTPQFDTAFVERFDVVRLHMDIYYPCALIRWFIHVGDKLDKVTDTNADGSPAVEVIHLDSVLHAAHLLPIFGNSFMPIKLSSHNALDAFETDYINKYIDYHAFEFAS
ncbi:hypothetical protein H4582DRAFT_2113416 [Lactarius indigo]|nr:hypothetical protein H4582DRAFT_2113416 [Lactarius indigo]